MALHLFVADGEARERDLQAVVARNRHNGPNLHDGIEGDGPAVLAPGDVDLGLGDGVELGVDDGAGVEVGQRLAQCLGTQCPGTPHTGLEHPARHLAGPETRHPNLLGQRAHDVAERTIELRLVHLNTQADEVSLHWLCCRTHHEPITLPAAPWPGRTAAGLARRVWRAAARSEHEVHGAQHGAAHLVVAVHTDTARSLDLGGGGPAAAEAGEVDARE